MGVFYGNFFKKAMSKGIDYLNDNIKCMLCTGDYVPSKDHVVKSEITNEADTTGGYPEGGILLEGKTMEFDGNFTTTLNANDIILNNTTVSDVRYLVIYVDTGVPETSLLIGYIDLEVPKGVTNGDFMITWSENGIFVHEAR